MAIKDIVFSEGDIQNFLVELPEGLLNQPKDFLLENGSNSGLVCLETVLEATAVEVPETIVLSDGQLAKRITSKFYLKL